jgi:hypothetical protein
MIYLDDKLYNKKAKEHSVYINKLGTPGADYKQKRFTYKTEYIIRIYADEVPYTSYHDRPIEQPMSTEPLIAVVTGQIELNKQYRVTCKDIKIKIKESVLGEDLKRDITEVLHDSAGQRFLDMFKDMLYSNSRKNKRVFLGGTINGKWRDKAKAHLEFLGIDYFDPVVDDWNEQAKKREIEERENCDFCLYVITPKMKGVYSIAEVVDDSNKRPKKTVFVILHEDDGEKFSKNMEHSLDAVAQMVRKNGAKVYSNLSTAIIGICQTTN